MKIGYACQCLSHSIPSFHTCTRRFATQETLISIIHHNLMVLDQILEYNHLHDIHLFRVSSDLIPFGSSPVNTVDWKVMFQSKFQMLGEKARKYEIRLTMHPGQYTILNTPVEDVLQRSIADLRYHCDMLNLMEMDAACKLILHVGGIYGDKTTALQRFQRSFYQLDDDIRQRLIIENDDRYYSLEDVLYLSNQLNIPVIFDNLHHELLPSLFHMSLMDTLNIVKKTWKQQDGRMKIHYSQQDPERRKGAHAQYLNGTLFMGFCRSIEFMDLDIMLEIKTKNLAALKAKNLLNPENFDIHVTWQHYRYLILRHSLSTFIYLEQNHTHMGPAIFYQWIDHALQQEEPAGICYRFLYHEWRLSLSETMDKKLLRALHRFENQTLSEKGLKRAFLMAAYDIGKENDYLFL